MKLNAHNEPLFDRITTIFSTVIKVVLSLLLIVTTTALCIGLIKSGLNIYHGIHEPLSTILQSVLLDAVFIVALVEIMLTILTYLDDGKVHVRYIVDTVLIIMLNEIVTTWFKHPDLKNAIGLSIIVATLAAVRVALTRTGTVVKRAK